VDCVHQRKPVIHNDYASLPHRKGLPSGHASVTRELIIPVIQNDRILAIVGIGNKPSEYDAEDVDIVSKLAMLAWDIAERKRFEEALKESEKQYRNIVETSLDGIWVINTDFQTTYLNQRMADMLGYTMEEILGKEVKSFIFEEDLEDYELRAASRRRSLSEVFERRFLRKDGTAVWSIISSTALCDNEGRFTGSYSMFTDITARKQAEEEVIRSRQELKAIYDHVQVMICVVDEHRHVLYANPALTKFTAVSEDELKGGTACGAFGCINALDDPRGCGFGANCPNCALRLAMEDTITTGTEHTNVEHHTIWMIKGCQRKVTLLLSTVLVHNADHNHLLLCMHDITDRKQSEDSLLASEKVARQLAQENELIAEIGRIISSTLNIEKVYERFAEKVKEAIHFDGIAINTISNAKDTRTLRYYNGTISGNRQKEVLLIAGTRTEHVVRTKSSLLIDSNNRNDIKIAFPGMLSRANSQSTMIIPLVSRDEVFATMTIHSAQMHAYSERDLRIAERVGSQIAGAIANAQLLHQCIQVEESLRESESKFRSLASTVDSLFLVDRDCRHLFANESYLASFGPMRDLVIGKKYEELHDEEVSRTFANSVNYVFDTGNSYHDEWLGGRTGKYLARTFGPVKNNEGIIVAVVISSKDITDRKQIEEALHESERAAKQLAKESDLLAEIGRIISSTLNIEEVYERFADKVAEVIPFDRIAVNAINVKDYTRTIRYAKGDKFSGDRIGKVIPLAGTGAEQAMLTKQSILISSRNREEMIKNFPGIVALQFGAQATMVIPLILHDEVFGALVLHSLMVDAYSEHDLHLAERVGAQIAGTIANVQLFHDRRQAEVAKQVLSDRLQRAEKMEALGNLAGGVAHDLNNVLGVLSGYSELLAEQLHKDKTLQGYAINILKSSEKGAFIIQDLLTMARRGVVVSEVVNINKVITNFFASPVAEQLKVLYPQIEITAELSADLFNIKGSPVHLEKSLMNLVSNAVEAVSGAGKVTIRTNNCYLDKAVRGYDTVEQGEYVLLKVSDTGSGISAADLDKIFEPFYTKKKMGRSGTGLGLAIVWSTVKDHNGYIDVQSGTDEGTTFTLFYPVTREEVDAFEEKIAIEEYKGNGESVLVVDDVEEQRQVVTTMLERLGYEVASVSSGEEAVEYLRKNNAQILVLDMIMEPGIDGLETYQQIVSFKPKQKAIIVSGFSETERVDMAKLLGAGAYVKKPYALEKIGVAIRDELARK